MNNKTIRFADKHSRLHCLQNCWEQERMVREIEASSWELTSLTSDLHNQQIEQPNTKPWWMDGNKSDVGEKQVVYTVTLDAAYNP